MRQAILPVGISLSADVEERGGGRTPFRARVRWVDPDHPRTPVGLALGRHNRGSAGMDRRAAASSSGRG